MTTTEFSLRKTDDGYDAVWPGLATLRVGRAPMFQAVPGADAAAVEKLRRGPAAGVECYLLRAGVGFHAAAVAYRDVGVVLAGESGAGKSTTAALMVARGAELLADDVAITRWAAGTLEIEPTEREHLLDDSSRALLGMGVSARERDAVKLGVPAARLARGPVAARVFVALEGSPSPTRALRVRGGAAMAMLARARVCPSTEEPQRAVEDLDILARVAEQLPVYRVWRGDDPEVLGSVLIQMIEGLR